MKIVVVPWTLLLAASLCTGHYIRQPEDNSAVFSVEDGSSGITLVNPKPKERTLREILYYHFIEREPGEKEHTITERSFTNSHGYQFLEKHPSSNEQELYDDEEHHEHEDDDTEREEFDQTEHGEHDEYEHEGDEHEVKEDTENQNEEETESTTKARPLTDADVKDAYKARSYLFDQMRQRYAVKRMADSLRRRKRQTQTEELKPLPNTYGMSITPEGGYVWNNLNKPNSYYELGASSGNPSEEQDASTQNQENKPSGDNTNEEQQNSENSDAINENSNDSNEDDLSDICVDINKPCALRLQTSQEPSYEYNENSEVNDSGVKSYESDDDDNDDDDNDSEQDDGVPNYPIGSVAFEHPELRTAESISNSGDGFINPAVNENPESSSNEANYPVEPIIADNVSDDGASSYPVVPEISENPESSYSADAVAENPDAIESDKQEKAQSGFKSEGSNKNAESTYQESQQEEFNPASAPEESSEGEKNMAIPEAPTLPPLNYDDLQGHINGDAVPADKPASYEQTDNPYINPQPYPEDTKEMEGVLATMQPPEDIPKTYGMNLTSDGGHVWNTLVNPPVSYDVGTSNENPEPINPIPEPNISDVNNPAETIISGEAASNSESNEASDSSHESASSENLSEPTAAEGPIDNANSQPDEPNSYGTGLAPDEGNTMNNPAVSYDMGSSNEQPQPNNSEVIPVEPVGSDASNENSESNEGTAYQEPEVANPEPTPVESNESYGSSYGGSQSEEKPESSSEGSSEEEKPTQPSWNIPEAPTLPPLNYDNLPDYIRNVISSTEKPEYYQSTEIPSPSYTYPPTSSEDKQTMEDKIEDIFATLKPIGDVPNTYGMSLNGDGGHVWNDMVNPPISYDVGSSSQLEEEHKEESQASEENVQPESHESEEAIQEQPAEEPTNQESESEPQIPETEDQPIDEPAEPETAEEFENPENPEPEQENINEEQKPSEENQENVEEHDNEPVEVKPEEGIAKPDIMDELLKSDQFWRWLGLWTATYMELLEKHIRKIALEEICKHQRIGNQMCPLDSYSEDDGVILKDEKDIVDDKESLETSDISTEDTKLKRGHHNQNNHNKADGNKIEASTIYGNSVGNEKVTNVFIFTADKADEVIDKLKPANDSEIDFIIDERIKEEESKDKNETPGDNEEPNEPETNNEETDKEGFNEELSNEGGVNIEESKESQADTSEIEKEEPIESQTNEEKGEIIEGQSNEAGANEEAANKEELEKEQSNENEPSEESLNKEEATEDAPKEGEVEGEEFNKKEESNESEANKEASNKGDALEEVFKEDASKGEANEKQLKNEEESIEGEANEEEVNEGLIEGEGDTEELNKDEETKGETRKGEPIEVELNKEEESKEGSNEGEYNKKELKKDEENKEESSEAKVNEELNKEAKEDEASEVSNESKEISEPEAEDKLNNNSENREEKQK